MDDERIAELERQVGELVEESVAHEYAITALGLALRDADAASVEGVHAFLMNAALAERQRGGPTAEGRATAVEVLADRLLGLSRKWPRLDDRGPD